MSLLNTSQVGVDYNSMRPQLESVDNLEWVSPSIIGLTPPSSMNVIPSSVPTETEIQPSPLDFTPPTSPMDFTLSLGKPIQLSKSFLMRKRIKVEEKVSKCINKGGILHRPFKRRKIGMDDSSYTSL
jgi:hypothetical protein